MSDGVNDKVWDLNWNTVQAWTRFVILHERFEQVNGDFARVDKEFEREFAQMEAEMEEVKEAQRFMEISAQA